MVKYGKQIIIGTWRCDNNATLLAIPLCKRGAQAVVEHDSIMNHSPLGHFLKGTHWRSPQPYWGKEWLMREYVDKHRSAADIADQFSCTPTNVLYFLHKHAIATRSISESRALKHWGASRETNPMFGKRGAEVPNWKGGITPLRQALYSSLAWADASRIVWERDRGHCQRCGQYDNGISKKSFHIHHIVHYSYLPLSSEPSNLVLLCHACHGWVHSKHNRTGFWMAEIPRQKEQ